MTNAKVIPFPPIHPKTKVRVDPVPTPPAITGIVFHEGLTRDGLVVIGFRCCCSPYDGDDIEICVDGKFVKGFNSLSDSSAYQNALRYARSLSHKDFYDD